MKNFTRKSSLLLAATALSPFLMAQQATVQHLHKDKTEGTHVSTSKPWMGHTPVRTVNPSVSPMACDSVSTTFAGGNGQNGNMFDITAVNTVTITQFYGNFDPATSPSGMVKIFYKSGSYMGSEGNSAAWTLVDSAMVTSMGAEVATPIPITMSVTIPAGQTYGFYVTGTGAMDVDYTDGTTEGTVYDSDANIQFKEGKGVEYPFGNTYTPRIWNGIIFYCSGVTGIDNVAANTGLTLQPNPFSDHATITFDKAVSNADIRVYDMVGKQVKRLSAVNTQTVEISREGLGAGVYFVQVTENNQTIATRKMIVR
jgi:hypothetical protein